jgi:aryl-alcohol dehydrogenase-like predicted oxidoreductase
MSDEHRGMDRRSFLKLSAATTSGLAIGGCSDTVEVLADMPRLELGRRPLGDTGLEVSEVSLGSYGFDNPSLLLAALDVGINTICTSANYQGGRAEEAIGRALATIGSRRDEVVVFTGDMFKSNVTTEQVLASIDGSLRRLQTDRVEIYRVTGVQSPEELRREPFLEAFERAREAGKVGHLGMSGHHGGMQECLNTAIDEGRYRVLFTKYDFASYPDQDAILGRAAKRGLGTIVFKTGAGNREKEIRDLERGGLSYQQATVKWALTNRNVASVCVGISNFRQIRDYAEAVGKPLEEAELAMLKRYSDEMHDQYCRFCAVCEPSCPHGVAVADVNRFAMYFKYYGREKDSMELYGGLPDGCTAEACRTCSAPCESACPFGRDVRKELVEADRLLSFRRV